MNLWRKYKKQPPDVGVQIEASVEMEKEMRNLFFSLSPEVSQPHHMVFWSVSTCSLVCSKLKLQIMPLHTPVKETVHPHYF